MLDSYYCSSYPVDMARKKNLKCKHPDCTNLIYPSNRASFSGNCHEHTDYTANGKRMGLWNKLFKSKPKELHHRAQNDYTVDCVCAQCGKTFKARYGNIHHKPNQKTHVCSKRCQGIRAAMLTPKKDTKIERLIESQLIARNWHYEKQKPIEDICLADFYVPHLNAVILCDGEYWHSLPRAKARMSTQNKDLRERGYNLFRFWEREILRDAAGCVDVVFIKTVGAVQSPLAF